MAPSARTSSSTIDDGAVDALLTRARREVDEGLLPSCQLALAIDGQVIVDETLGDAASDSRYVIFSCTKALVAASIWLLIGDDQLDVARPVCEVIPEFATNGKQDITIEQLLIHTAGFPHAPLDPRRVITQEDRIEAFARWRLNWEPGTRFEYHPTSAHWVLGEIIHRVTGEDLASFVRRRILDPLELERLRLGERVEQCGDVNTLIGVGEPPTSAELEAVTGIPDLDFAELVGEVTNEVLLSFNEPGALAIGIPGAGAVSTAADLARLYQAFLHNPAGLWDPSVLADGTGVIRTTLPHPVHGIAANRSLGLVIAGAPPESSLRGFGLQCSPRAFGHGGAGGQISWADPESGLSFAYLTNGLDANVIREARRGISLSSLAAQAIKRRMVKN